MAKIKKKKNKMSLKDMKAPDDFQVKMAGFTPFLERHGIKVIGLVVVAIALLIGVYMFIRMNHSKTVETSVAVQTRINDVLNAAVSGDKSRVDTEVRAISTLKTDGKPYGIAVEISSGSALLAVDKYQEAAKHFQKALTLMDKDDALYPFLQETLANCLVSAGKYKDASEALGTVSTDTLPAVQARAYMLKGDIFNNSILPKTTLKSAEKAAKEYAAAQKALKTDPSQADYSNFLMHMTELRSFTLTSGG